MGTINRVIVSKGSCKIDYTGLPNAPERVDVSGVHPNVKTVTVTTPAAPDVKKIKVGHGTTLSYTGTRGKISGSR